MIPKIFFRLHINYSTQAISFFFFIMWTVSLPQMHMFPIFEKATSISRLR